MALPSAPGFQAEVLTIGAELLKGSTLNTNARFLGRELTWLGFKVFAQTSCRDYEEDICAFMAAALHRSDLVILTGGLGPTPDDVTRDAVAKFFGSRLVFSPVQFRRIRRLYRFRSRPVPDIVRREALFPETAEPLINRHGIALGFLIRHNGKLVVVLPGVPGELEKMFRELVRPILLAHFKGIKPKSSFRMNLAGISEPEVMRRLRKDFFEDPIEFGIYPSAGEISVTVQAATPRIIRTLRQKAAARLRTFIYGWDNASFAEVIGKLLVKRKRTLSLAESCTGGSLAAEMTKTAGASRYFKGSVTAYDNSIKIQLLGISPETVRKFGAVSEQTARALAVNVRRRMKTDYGLSVTGIAGPSGGSARKPVGTVYIGLAGPRRARVWKERFDGDRERIQRRAVMKALGYLWQEIR